MSSLVFLKGKDKGDFSSDLFLSIFKTEISPTNSSLSSCFCSSVLGVLASFGFTSALYLPISSASSSEIIPSLINLAIVFLKSTLPFLNLIGSIESNKLFNSGILDSCNITASIISLARSAITPASSALSGIKSLSPNSFTISLYC